MGSWTHGIPVAKAVLESNQSDVMHMLFEASSAWLTVAGEAPFVQWQCGEAD